MTMEVRTSELNPDVTIAALCGRLDMAMSTELSPELMQTLEESPNGLIIDIAEIEFISSAGLRVLIAASKKAKALDTKLALIRAKPPVYKIFKIASLGALFTFSEDEAGAIKALWQ